jgi:glycosyltransferase involved in cell wall biosynthesis
MDAQPAVSVIITTYNRPDSLLRAINSVLDQTFDNLECIVVDDCPSDHRTETVIESIEDNRVEYVQHEENHGLSASLNTGIEYAQGNYIAFLDDDDIWYPRKLKLQMQRLKEDNQMGLVYTGIEYKTKDERQIAKTLPEYQGEVHTQLLARNEIGTLSCILVRSKAIDEITGFDEELTTCSDWDFYIRLTKFFKIGYVKEILVRKQFHSGSVLDDSKKHIKSRECVIQKHLQDIAGNEQLPEANFYKYRDIGIQSCLRGDMVIGREMFRKASRHKRDLTLSILFILSYLGFRMFRSVVMMKTSFDYYCMMAYKLITPIR